MRFVHFVWLVECYRNFRDDVQQFLLIAPIWPTQTWYPALLTLSVMKPILLPAMNNLLYLVNKPTVHPMGKKLRFAAWILSASISEREAFLSKQPNWCALPGRRGQKSNIDLRGRNSVAGVAKNKLIHFKQLQHRWQISCQSSLVQAKAVARWTCTDLLFHPLFMWLKRIWLGSILLLVGVWRVSMNVKPLLLDISLLGMYLKWQVICHHKVHYKIWASRHWHKNCYGMHFSLSSEGTNSVSVKHK